MNLSNFRLKHKRLLKITSIFSIVIICIFWQPGKESIGQRPRHRSTPVVLTESERKNIALKAIVKKNDDSIKAIILTDNKTALKTKIVYRWRTRYLPAKAAARDTVYVNMPLEIEEDYILDTLICKTDTLYLPTPIVPKKKKILRIF